MISKQISLCVIIKNSSDTLDIFFNWALDYFEEICVVVDPQNYDTTLQDCYRWSLVPQFTTDIKNRIIIVEHPFDNFSNQWNRSFKLASKEWIFYIGSDEILSPCNYDSLIPALQRLKKKVGTFPRYNLQTSRHQALEIGYPDYQFRLFNKNDEIQMDGKAVDESINCKDSYMIFPQHIIHLGHIRPHQALLQKGIDRIKFKDTDACDGSGLTKFGEKWFLERNKEFEKFVFSIQDQEVLEHIDKYIPLEFLK
jgi:glycosyltransferase involved in cell wall biosynthesis